MCIRYSLHSVRFGQLFRCAHKRIVNIMKVYIERKNMQVELIQFSKQISHLFTFRVGWGIAPRLEHMFLLAGYFK